MVICFRSDRPSAIGLGLWLFLLAPPVVNATASANPEPPLARLALSYALASVPVEAVQRLSSSDAVRAAFNDSLGLRSAVSGLQLQGERLATVERAVFLPKLATTAAVQRTASRPDGVRQSTVQTQAGLDLNWRLPTGAQVRISDSRTRNGVSGALSSATVGTDTQRNVSIALTQPLLQGAGRTVNEAQLAAAESAFRVAAGRLYQTAGELVAVVLNAYLGVQQAQAALQQAQIAYALAQQVNDLNVALVQAGRSPRNVLLQSGLDVSSSRLNVAQAENSLRQAVRVLERAMGRSEPLDEQSLALDKPFEGPEQEGIPDEQVFVEAALRQSVQLLAAREVVVLAEVALAAARDGLLPALALTVGSEWTPSGSAAVRNGPNHFAGLSLSYSFDRAPAQMEERVALSNLEIARAELADVERQVRDDAVDGLRNLRFALEQLRLMREAFALATQQLDAEVTRQRLGRISPLELSYAQQALAAANRQLLDATREVSRSRIGLALTDGSLLNAWGVETLVNQWIAQAKPDSLH